jgi:hypothetical protein
MHFLYDKITEKINQTILRTCKIERKENSYGRNRRCDFKAWTIIARARKAVL